MNSVAWLVSCSLAGPAIGAIVLPAVPQRLQSRLAGGGAMICHALAVAGLMLTLDASLGLLPGEFRHIARSGLTAAFPFVAALAWSSVALLASAPANLRVHEMLLRAVARYVGLAFIGFEIGKLRHDEEMRAFFTSSGLSVWFMYLVMSVETAAAAGLLFGWHRAWAAGALAALMVGAIGTHVLNGDPLGDALDACNMLTLTAAIVTYCAIRYVQKGRLGGQNGYVEQRTTGLQR
ncbi:hypothetical protein E4L96_06110 [Massilia arenosa]|uniref:DoxX family protein n=1 Tax=Zemynaea arenosa TaxID=2561931 RepID=A0A4Y9SIC6_9BURK|nr:DoxX family protein [Massilia arenosa]TFW24502.1 hypothetical protein E4L96_06110 [Massilia arenosa]